MTRIAILGAGNVARTLAPSWTAAGHAVTVSSRRTLSSTAAGAEVVVNALPGAVSVDVLGRLAPVLSGKVLIDVANAVEQGPDGFASRLLYPNLAARLQRLLPSTRVVKALNTAAAPLMAAPGATVTPPSTFLCGDDPGAKKTVTALVVDLGWQPPWIIDLGGIDNAWWPESFVLMVRPLIAALGPIPFAPAIARC